MKIVMNLELSTPEELLLIAKALTGFANKPVEPTLVTEEIREITQAAYPVIQKPTTAPSVQKPIFPSPQMRSAAPAVPPVQSVAPIAAPPTYPQPIQAPVALAPQYTFDQLQRAGAELMDAGRIKELQGLLAKYNITRLPELHPQMYGAYATDLKALGARL